MPEDCPTGFKRHCNGCSYLHDMRCWHPYYGGSVFVSEILTESERRDILEEIIAQHYLDTTEAPPQAPKEKELSKIWNAINQTKGMSLATRKDIKEHLSASRKTFKQYK